MWGLRPVALQPKGVVMTFVDLGPRLITVTHHDAVTGPYHRNGQQIADVMNFWRGSADQAHALAAKYHVELCAELPEQLDHDDLQCRNSARAFTSSCSAARCPNWLTPVPLPKDSPYRMWKVVG